MAEGKAGPHNPGVPEGWESDSSPEGYRNFSSSGRGATTADHPDGEAGEGTYGGGRGTDYTEPPRTIPGDDVAEFPREGWGEEGENFPPTQGPLGPVYAEKADEEEPGR